MQRPLNSTVPFSHMTQRDNKVLNCPGSSPASRTESKGGELDKIDHLSIFQNYFRNVMCKGTANYEWTHRTEKQSIIAQAECKYWFKQTQTESSHDDFSSKYKFGLNCFPFPQVSLRIHRSFVPMAGKVLYDCHTNACFIMFSLIYHCNLLMFSCILFHL